MKARFQPTTAAGIEEAASRWIARRDAGFSAADEAGFKRWLAADERHAEALARHEQAWSIVGRAAATGRGPVLARELDRRAARRRRRSAGAVATAALVFAGWLWSPLGWRPERLLPVTPMAVVVSPERQVLPDGSVVDLKAGAEIAIDFSGDFRRITLRRGEAHFEVVSDTVRPFVVAAGAVEVRAVGTAFSVQWEREEVQVLVSHGRVAVARTGADSPAPPPPEREPAVAQPPEAPAARVPAPPSLPSLPATYLDAGERIVLPASGTTSAVAIATVVTPDELMERLAWRQVWLEFTGTPLAEAVALMNRHSAGSAHPPLVIDPAETSLAQLEVSGYFRADSTDTFLRLIEQTLGVQVERGATSITLRRAR